MRLLYSIRYHRSPSATLCPAMSMAWSTVHPVQCLDSSRQIQVRPVGMLCYVDTVYSVQIHFPLVELDIHITDVKKN